MILFHFVLISFITALFCWFHIYKADNILLRKAYREHCVPLGVGIDFLIDFKQYY